jgi:type VI secretion system protein VasG
MIGAGGAAGQNDAANLLKPALARGELRTMAATTWSEYKKYFEKDPALSRRFQLVKVEEPSEDVCMQMLRGLLPSLEKHHNVRIVDSGLEAAVRLSHRYLPDRQLPDKAVSVLDTTCARLALDQSATPSALEAVTRRIEDLDVQKRVLEREVAVGANHADRLESIAAERKQREDELNQLTERWKKESSLVSQIREIRQQLEQHHAGEKAAANAADLKTKLSSFDKELEELQGQKPLIRVVVDAGIVGEVISGWTGIPVGKMLRDEMGMVLEMEKHLGARVIGQDVALEQISRRVRTSRAGIEDPQKPKGVFMLVGPSGVGKTETALALSDLLYGGEQNLITINMSEFQEAHTVSTLKGSPPGYVGYGEGGVLTEAVRRRPYSVVLLDEVEKAHPDVLELFFQVFDKGRMEDGEGREIDFKNTVIILTTNAGTDTIMSLTADPETMPSHDGLTKALKPELDKTFKPAFLGRMVIIPYFPVRDENLKQIVRLKINKIRRRIAETHKVRLTYGDDVVNAVAARCTEVESGARNVDNILSNTMLPEMSRALLAKMAEGGGIGAITVGVGADGNLTYDIADAAPKSGGVSAADAVLGSSLNEEQAAAAL